MGIGTGAGMDTGVGIVAAPGRGVLYMISPSSSMAAGITGAGKRMGRGRRIDERELGTNLSAVTIGPPTKNKIALLFFLKWL